MTPLPIIDTHVHFFDLGHPKLRYLWLEPEFIHPILGNIDAIKSRRYDINSVWAEARFANIAGFVHVQAALGTKDPVLETEWLTEMRAEAPAPFTIVGTVDLKNPNAETVIDRHLRSPYFVGVRDFSAEKHLATGVIDANFERGLAALAERNLIYDFDCEWINLEAARDVAARHPSLTLVLEHLAFPRRRDDEYFDQWSKALAKIATQPNVYLKISGVGMTDPRGSATNYQKWIAHGLETFGAERCLLGSNWPLDRLVSSYDAIMEIYRSSLCQLPIEQQRAVASENGLRLYRVR